MVARLTLPDDSAQIVEEVIDERSHYQDFYDAIKADWISSVLSYIENSGDPNLVPPLDIQKYLSKASIDEEGKKVLKDKEERDPKIRLTTKRINSLIGLYTPAVDKKPYDILETMRRKHGLLFCPSCGEPGKPGTLDHYLPKTTFPELSIVIANLTPMCSECQGRKGTDFINENGEKLFLHPYFDTVDEALISVEIIPPYASPGSFNISVNSNIVEPLKSLAERHVEGIDFNDRFAEFCRIEYMTLLSNFSEEREDESPDTATRIINRFLRKANKQSQNRWEAIFYRGILANNKLLDYLDNGELPKYL